MKKTKKKLSLAKETLRTLNDKELAHVPGGATIRGTCHTRSPTMCGATNCFTC
jgi:natural product precursor